MGWPSLPSFFCVQRTFCKRQLICDGPWPAQRRRSGHVLVNRNVIEFNMLLSSLGGQVTVCFNKNGDASASPSRRLHLAPARTAAPGGSRRNRGWSTAA